MKPLRITFTLLAIALGGQTLGHAQDPLPSWNDGPTKQAIVDFVRATTESGGSHVVNIGFPLSSGQGAPGANGQVWSTFP